MPPSQKEMHVNLGKVIKLCRIQKKMKQEDLAFATGLSVSYLSLLEREKRRYNIESIQAIANALKVPLWVFFFLIDDRTETDRELEKVLRDAALRYIYNL